MRKPGSLTPRGVLLVSLVLALACSSSDPDEILVSGEKLYSQYDEELIIRHFFGDRRGGVFVDVGAYHWKDSSTTYFLEKHLGWSGIAIDALEQFAAGYEKNRPRTQFFSYIVTDHSGTMDKFYSAGPLSSTNRDHIDEVVAVLASPDDPDNPRNSHIEEIREAWNLSDDQLDSLRDFESVEIQVETITLNELLDRNGIERIDFLSLDIEQGEPAALAGFDIERFKPELVCLEAFVPVREKIAAYFESHGYERIEKYREYDEFNWYYRPKAPPGS